MIRHLALQPNEPENVRRPKLAAMLRFLIGGGAGVGGACLPALGGVTAYVPPETVDFSAATAPITANELYFLPLQRRLTVSHLAIEITTAGAAGTKARLGVYAADGIGGIPKTLLADLGDVATDSVGVKEAAFSAPLVIGEPTWLVALFSGTPVIRGGTINAAASTRIFGVASLTAAGAISGVSCPLGAYRPLPVVAPAATTYRGSARVVAARLAA